MAINKKLRQQVLDKYGCKCGYCGKDIDIKTMQVDHIMPKAYSMMLQLSPESRDETLYRRYGLSSDITNIDDIKNLMPACRQCNHYKRGMSLEQFRGAIITLHERIDKHYINKVAVNFGIINQPQEWDGDFYFERVDK